MILIVQELYRSCYLRSLIHRGSFTSALPPCLLRCVPGSRYLLLPSVALVASYIIGGILAFRQPDMMWRHGLVDECFLHWYTPSLFKDELGASIPSRSMVSNWKVTVRKALYDDTNVRDEHHRSHRSPLFHRTSSRYTLGYRRSTINSRSKEFMNIGCLPLP